MTPLVAWVADLLLAAWQRQEREGRYRGADDFRALHIDPADALASWRAATEPAVAWPPRLADGFALLHAAGQADGAAWLPAGLGLDEAERLIATVTAAVEVEPRLRPLVAALTDDPGVRLPTAGLLTELAGAVGVPPAEVRAAVAPEGRLAFLDLVQAVPTTGRPSPADALLVASGWLIEAADGGPVDQHKALTSVNARVGVPSATPVLLSGADHRTHAEALASPSGRVLLVAAPTPEAIGPAVRAALIDDAALAVATDGVPEPWLVSAADRAAALGCPIALSLPAGASWVPPAHWRQETLRPAGPDARARRWADALAAAGGLALPDDMVTIAGEYALGLDAIEEAVRRVSAAGVPGEPLAPTLASLRVAARRTAWRDLSSCARPGPIGNRWDDLVVTPAVRTQLRDIAAAIGHRGRVLDEWGFGGRPGSRGYHVLFAGPSGTGKTMSAGVIAEATGLELWVVDLARVVDKYLGETEKAIDKVLRAAQSAGAMLLFDEADALFGRRGEVKEAKDRWANVEVAFLLQRIEEHDGVTVLTTNVSHHLDEAFARRMSQRVEFTVPDARLRRLLWAASMPADAPLASLDDLGLVAGQFELAGGAIRTAALNAAYEAAAQQGAIELPHLVRASVRELAKAGRTPTRADLGDLGAYLVDAP